MKRISSGNPALALHGPQICPNLIEASPDTGWQPNDDGRHRRHLRSHDDEIGIEKGNVVLIFAKWSPRMIDTVHMASGCDVAALNFLSKPRRFNRPTALESVCANNATTNGGKS